MNKWWVVGLAFPAIAGIAWIATKDATNTHSRARLPNDSAASETTTSPAMANSQASSVPRQTEANPVPSISVAKPIETAVSNEPLSIKELQELLDKDPATALLRARKDLARDPNGPDAAERNWVIVKSLAVLGRYEEARGEAKTMVAKFPGTRWANDVERHILAHP